MKNATRYRTVLGVVGFAAVALVAVGLGGIARAEQSQTAVVLCANAGGSVTLPDRSGSCKTGQVSMEFPLQQAVANLEQVIFAILKEVQAELRDERALRIAAVEQATEAAAQALAAAQETITAEREAAEAKIWAAIAAIDADGDGVPNTIDSCPDLAGPPENAGCPKAE